MFKIGDKVVLRSKPRYNWNPVMEQYMGKPLTISRLRRDDGFDVAEDDGRWFWDNKWDFVPFIKKNPNN